MTRHPEWDRWVMPVAAPSEEEQGFQDLSSGLEGDDLVHPLLHWEGDY